MNNSSFSVRTLYDFGLQQVAGHPYLSPGSVECATIMFALSYFDMLHDRGGYRRLFQLLDLQVKSAQRWSAFIVIS